MKGRKEKRETDRMNGEVDRKGERRTNTQTKSLQTDRQKGLDG